MSSSPIRARDLGIPFSGNPGPLNAITDVAGVEVGYATLWSGEGRLVVGQGPVRTGVTAILPRGRGDRRHCFGGSFALNGAGEVTGLTWLEERGLCEGPILITNTHAVGVVRDAAVQWMRRENWPFAWACPIVGETYDGHFSDIDGGHIRPEHVYAALDGARGGAVAEGNVGGGAGMTTFQYKGGTGTASRRLAEIDGGYTVGVLVQSNFGERRLIRIGGVPMGEALSADLPRFMDPDLVSDDMRARFAGRVEGLEPRPAREGVDPGEGSIIVVVATDAPLLPHQLRRLAKRPSLGIGRVGGTGAATSGDIFVALSTANPDHAEAKGQGAHPYEVSCLPNQAQSALFEAVIDATEEAILNALAAGETAIGANALRVPALPHDKVREKLKAHNLLAQEL